MSELESGTAASDALVDDQGSADSTSSVADHGSVAAEAQPAGALDGLLGSSKDGDGSSSQEAEASQPSVPEAYEFKASEGFEPLSGDVADSATAVFKELGLSQEAADKLAPLGEQLISNHIKQQAAQWESQSDAWMKAARADKEYGGEKLQANIARANAFMERFASPELTKYLTETRLINHPELIRLFVKAGSAMAEDRPSSGEQGSGDRKSNAEVFYGK